MAYKVTLSLTYAVDTLDALRELKAAFNEFIEDGDFDKSVEGAALTTTDVVTESVE